MLTTGATAEEYDKRIKMQILQLFNPQSHVLLKIFAVKENNSQSNE